MKTYLKKRISKSKINKDPVIIIGLLSILDGIIPLITFGYYYGNFAYEYTKQKLLK